MCARCDVVEELRNYDARPHTLSYRSYGCRGAAMGGAPQQPSESRGIDFGDSSKGIPMRRLCMQNAVLE